MAGCLKRAFRLVCGWVYQGVCNLGASLFTGLFGRIKGGRLAPRGLGGEGGGIDGAAGMVGAGQVAGAHQEFTGDFAAGEFKSLLEEFDPVGGALGVVGVEPVFEGTVLCLQVLDNLGVVDGGVDFQAVAYDAGVVQQALAVGVGEGGNGGDVETGVGGAEGGGFVQD